LNSYITSPWRSSCRTQTSARMLQPRRLGFAALLTLGAIWPPEVVAGGQAFTVQEVPTKNRRVFNGAELMKRTHLKYGVKVPDEVERAIRISAEDAPLGKATVKTWPLFEDMEYVMPVDIGGQTLALQLDTGSSDL
jgi:aspergillopepsin I